jgi:hypothetical protein
MSLEKQVQCPECEGQVEPLDRRDFIRVVGVGTAAAVAVGGVATTTLPAVARAAVPPQAAQPRPRPAEAMVRELFAGLTAEQRETIVHPWNHGADNNQTPTRLRMFNRPITRTIGQVFTRPQQELVERTLRAIANGDEGYQRLSRNNTFDSSGSLQGSGVDIFGDPTTNQWSWVFSSHHLTVRCDGNSEPGAAFGGPLYYGHSPNGYSDRNVFNYQTRSSMAFFDSLSEQQRRMAIVGGNPGEQENSVRFRPANQPHPGIHVSELTADQKRLVETVMRQLLSPYRQEDGDEVMQILRQNGGLDAIHFAFYRSSSNNAQEPWSFWRLEGPGFVWNFRVLPHVHTFVHISNQVQNGVLPPRSA